MQNKEIQLLPGKSRQTVGIKNEEKKNKILVYGIIIIAAVLLVGFSLIYLKSSIEEEILNLDSQLNTLEQKRDKKFEKNIIVIKKQLGLVSGLIDKHPYWTDGLTIIENLLQDKVQIENVDFDSSKNEINLIGSAANLSTIARQIASFLSDDFIEDISLQETETQNTGVVEFGMTLKIKQDKLLKNDQLKKKGSGNEQ